MTTFVAFQPTQTSVFQFQVTLDNVEYQCTVVWSLFGRRYYINIIDLTGNLIVSEALVGSPAGLNIQSLSWSAGKVRAALSVPHGFKIGSVIDLTISGCTPDIYNGDFTCFITSPTGFTYDLASDPGGPASALGAATYNINLVGGYFTISKMVFRESNQQFEVSP